MKKIGLFLLVLSIAGCATSQQIIPPPGVVIHNSKAETHKYVGSPSIAILPDGTYVASHDYFGKGRISEAFVYRSEDKGKTWKQSAMIHPLNWASLFVFRGNLYLLGVRPKCGMGYGDIVILRSTDGGRNWTNPNTSKNGLIREGYYHSAPTPVVVHNHKIWKAMEEQGKNGGWGPFSSFMLTVNEDTDLLDATNWNMSNSLFLPAGFLEDAYTWLEGNIVVMKDQSVKNIIRVHYMPDNKVGMIDVSPDGMTQSINRHQLFSDFFPGSGKKFTIRYDSITNKYWTLSNYVQEKDQREDNQSVRNTIVLASSDDLNQWAIRDTLLHHPNVDHYGFQYIDWLFEGNDIIAVSRTAWQDSTGLPPRQHDANYLTFHRFKNFRKK